MTTDADPTAGVDLERLVRNGLVETYFAPVVDLATGGPAGFRVEHANREEHFPGPDSVARLRHVLRESPTSGDLDASLRALGLRAAEALGIEGRTRLFLTAEPESLVTLEDRTDDPERSIILQLDPSTIRESPATVLRSVRQARALGWGIGIKSVGPDLATAAFLPLINPSVVALDKAVLDIKDPALLAELIRILHAHTERTGAVILAEGVRDDDDLVTVRALGARLVTGPMFGEATPHPEPSDPPREDALADHFTRNLPVQGTPFSNSQGLKRDPLVMDEEMLRAQLASLGDRALDAGRSAIAIGVFACLEQLSESTFDRFVRLRDSAGFTALFSGEWQSSPIDGVRSGPLDASDPLRDEYAMIVVGPDWSAMVAADRRVDLGPDGRTEFDVYVTTERYTVVDAARSVLTRISD